jgi:putative flippase GtrA
VQSLIKIAHDLWLNHQKKLRFVLVGIWNTIFGYLVFVACDYLFERLFSPRYVAYMTAAVLSNILAIINAYIFQKHITFQSTVRGKGILIEFARFFSTYLFSMILGLILLPVSVEALGIPPKVSAAMLIPVTMIFSYLGHSRFSILAKIFSMSRLSSGIRTVVVAIAPPPDTNLQSDYSFVK